jgi:hypothetical protein
MIPRRQFMRRPARPLGPNVRARRRDKMRDDLREQMREEPPPRPRVVSMAALSWGCDANGSEVEREP